jgi:hypothetical protein
VTLQLCDFLLTEHDDIEVELGTRMVDGVAFNQVSITNTRGLRKTDANSPARRPYSAPGGKAFLHHRLELLRSKVHFYRQEKNLTEREKDFHSRCCLALTRARRRGEAVVRSRRLEDQRNGITEAHRHRRIAAGV